jgi:transposase InsO family protein
VRTSKANAVAERVVRSIREERTDRRLILSQPHLLFTLKLYLAYDNERRPHQGLGQQSPVPILEWPQPPAAPEQVRYRPMLGGLIRDYAA